MWKHNFCAVILSASVVLVPDVPLAKPGGMSTPQTSASQKQPRPQQETVQETPSRGQMLYRNHCTGCHTSVVHVREKQRASDPAALRKLVVKWARQQRLEWSAADIDDVSRYLIERYYRFKPKP